MDLCLTLAEAGTVVHHAVAAAGHTGRAAGVVDIDQVGSDVTET